ncbi:MAG: serine/threonine protein kinase [Kofleriaceae bacterium]|nr:serine/threonine protein kinase [Kofleriaceae bacterium]MBP9208615.1 serine/threonine protein kinase [Kofleriaceae bacterium]
MSSGNQGKDGTGSVPGRPAADTPKPQIRADVGAGDSATISAADTAMALAVDVSSSAVGHAETQASGSGGSRPGRSSGGGGTPAPVDDDGLSDSGMVSMSALVGTTLAGRYKIERKVGQGGMGAVFEGINTSIGRKVAVKVLLDKYARREAIVARLEQEARLATTIGHEHIIDMLDFGQTDDGRTFVVMEYLEGESLAECLHRETRLPEQRILRLALQVASALGAAHAKGIVHRDIKPENVFLLQRKDTDFVKVVDFGISKSLRASDPGEEGAQRLTQTGMVLGTPLYMSPEQARGDDDLDHRIDIYALGVIMYEAATGRVPFLGNNYLAVISQVLSDDATPPRELRPDLSEEFEAIVQRALEKDRDRRYQSMAELAADLGALIEDPSHSSERARITSPRKRPPPRSNLRRNLLWGAGAVGLVGATVAAVTLLGGGGGDGSARGALGVDAAVAVAAAPTDAAPARPVDAAELQTVEFVIVSTPPGAEIFAGNKFLGTSPARFVVELAAPEQVLYARLDGHDDGELRITPQVDLKQFPDLHIPMRLSKVERGGKRRVLIKQGTDKPGGKAGDGARPPAGGGDLGGSPYGKQ